MSGGFCGRLGHRMYHPFFARRHKFPPHILAGLRGLEESVPKIWSRVEGHSGVEWPMLVFCCCIVVLGGLLVPTVQHHEIWWRPPSSPLQLQVLWSFLQAFPRWSPRGPSPPRPFKHHWKGSFWRGIHAAGSPLFGTRHHLLLHAHRCRISWRKTPFPKSWRTENSDSCAWVFVFDICCIFWHGTLQTHMEFSSSRGSTFRFHVLMLERQRKSSFHLTHWCHVQDCVFLLRPCIFLQENYHTKPPVWIDFWGVLAWHQPV